MAKTSTLPAGSCSNTTSAHASAVRLLSTQRSEGEVRARGHLTGGAVVALSTTATAIASHRIPAADHPLAWGLAATVLFFSLFPDVDTASLPQRCVPASLVRLLLLYM